MLSLFEGSCVLGSQKVARIPLCSILTDTPKFVVGFQTKKNVQS